MAVSRRDLLRLGGVVPLVGLASGVTGCDRGGGSAPPLSPYGSPRTVGPPAGSPAGTGRSVLDFGALGDGRTDDTAALQRAFAAARPADTLSLPAGRSFLHSDVLVLAVPRVRLTGGGTLVATDEERSALQVSADGVVVQGIGLSVPHTTRRWQADGQHRLLVGAHDGVVVRDVDVRGAAATGVFLSGSRRFLLERVSVADSRADGIHITAGSTDGEVRGPMVTRTGDDGVAVVSYDKDQATCRSIRITAPVVRGTTGGRGISVVGGEDITYVDVDVQGSRAAAVYIACEGSPYDTRPTRRVQVLGGTIRDANTDTGIDHGAVLVYSGRDGGDVADVLVTGLQISGTRAGASRHVGVLAEHACSGIRLEDLHLTGGPAPFSTTRRGALTSLAAWTLGGAPYPVTG